MRENREVTLYVVSEERISESDKEMDIKELLGKTARDQLTKFEGVITGYAQHIGGPVQLLIESDASKSEGKEIWFNINRLDIIDKTKEKK